MLSKRKKGEKVGKKESILQFLTDGDASHSMTQGQIKRNEEIWVIFKQLGEYWVTYKVNSRLSALEAKSLLQIKFFVCLCGWVGG